MMHKRLAALAMALVLLLVLTTPAIGATIKGSGFLFARGSGLAKIEGSGKVHIRGNGVLWVKDVAGDAQIVVNGYGKKVVYEDGTVCYKGFHGVANISGSHLRIKVKGVRIHLWAKGSGKAFLKGKGIYRTKKKSGKWSPKGIVIEIKK
jgi:uncharacterized protein (AIM24 family)